MATLLMLHVVLACVALVFVSTNTKQETLAAVKLEKAVLEGINEKGALVDKESLGSQKRMTSNTPSR